MDYLSMVPKDVYNIIYQYLSIKDIIQLTQTCTYFNKIKIEIILYDKAQRCDINNIIIEDIGYEFDSDDSDSNADNFLCDPDERLLYRGLGIYVTINYDHKYNVYEFDGDDFAIYHNFKNKTCLKTHRIYNDLFSIKLSHYSNKLFNSHIINSLINL